MRPKLLFLITEDWYFWSHRLGLARAAQRNCYEVIVATRVNEHAERILTEGFKLIPLRLKRESYSPLEEIAAIRQLRRIYKTEQPDIVHHVALKPLLYGSFAALPLKKVRVLNALAGQGYLSTSSSLKARVLRFGIWNALRFLMKRPRNWALVQNDHDRDFLIQQIGMPPEKVFLVRGSGVDIDLFRPSPEPEGIPVVLLASRMLWNKGVREFVEAAQLLHQRGLAARFILVGRTDPSSPAAIPEEQLLRWQSTGLVEWWRHQDDMPATLAQANLVCLPSYAEGVPKILLEAAATARAIVTTDVPGCREVVDYGVNGLLVPPRNSEALAQAIAELLSDPVRRREMGHRGREICETYFSERLVIDSILQIYRDISGSAVQPSRTEAMV